LWEVAEHPIIAIEGQNGEEALPFGAYQQRQGAGLGDASQGRVREDFCLIALPLSEHCARFFSTSSSHSPHLQAAALVDRPSL
jgi:hypothetical protein